ncbi:hypothetical protein F5146DRAFT_336220 [Armillaria mellea]|nr:hypothetical protein F5146DRAFT_336220 [Armillaria mellea]
MESFNRKRTMHRNASNSSPLALSSSSMPAPAVGSPLNDAAPVKGKGKLSRFFRRQGKHRYVDTTSDVAATLSASEGPALQSNKSSTTATSQPLSNAQAMTTNDSSDNNNLAGTLSENKTANAGVILDIVKDICEVLDKVPYLEIVIGMASKAVTIIEAVNACKGEWDTVKGDLIKVRDIVFEFRYGWDDSVPLPDDVKFAFQELEICLREVLDAVIRYQDVSMGRLVLERCTLKAEATSCVRCIDMAIKVFQVCQLCICI